MKVGKLKDEHCIILMEKLILINGYNTCSRQSYVCLLDAATFGNKFPLWSTCQSWNCFSCLTLTNKHTLRTLNLQNLLAGNIPWGSHDSSSPWGIPKWRICKCKPTCLGITGFIFCRMYMYRMYLRSVKCIFKHAGIISIEILESDSRQLSLILLFQLAN
jgi:hypothetical protein